MTSVTMVTSFSPEGWTSYAKRMLATAIQYLPKSISIKAYYNNIKPDFPESERIEFIDNYSIPRGVSEFISRHGNNQRLWGRIPGQEKENFRFSANRFIHKSEALYHASQNTQSNILTWIDSDVIFFSEVPESFFETSLPYPHYACFLDRGPRYHFETGFFSLRTKHPYHQEVMQRYIDYFRKDLFLKEAEYHDAWITSILIRQMVKERKITYYNLSPGYDGAGHPWLVSALAEFSDHVKGEKRKRVGKSFQEDLKISRSEPYWQRLSSRKNLI